MATDNSTATTHEELATPTLEQMKMAFEQIATMANSLQSLCDDILRELTGCSIKKKQIEQLRAMGVPFIMNTAGKLVVTADAAAVAGSHE
jgi:hypothetical protein